MTETTKCTICAAVESPGFYTGCLIIDGHGDGTWLCDGKGNLTRTVAPKCTMSTLQKLRGAFERDHRETAALGTVANPVWISKSLYDRAKAEGYDMTGYAISRMMPLTGGKAVREGCTAAVCLPGINGKCVGCGAAE